MTPQTPLLSNPYITQYKLTSYTDSSKILSIHMHFYNVLSLLLSLTLVF